jgi:hypothetical protein
MTLPVEEFLRRFLLHLLPPGFVRIRNFGFLANRNRATLLPLCFRLLGGLEKRHLQQQHRLPTRLTRYGSVQPVAEPCMWSNGSLPRNSCFALHLDRASALHESPSRILAIYSCFGMHADPLPHQPWSALPAVSSAAA